MVFDVLVKQVELTIFTLIGLTITDFGDNLTVIHKKTHFESADEVSKVKGGLLRLRVSIGATLPSLRRLPILWCFEHDLFHSVERDHALILPERIYFKLLTDSKELHFRNEAAILAEGLKN